MCIDQASVAGNVEVLNTIMEKILALPHDWFNTNRKIVIAGDQLTVSRVSTAMQYKSIDVSPYYRLQKRVSLTDFEFHASDELLRHTFTAVIRRIWESALEDANLSRAAEGMSDQQRKSHITTLVEELFESHISPFPEDLQEMSNSNRNMALFVRHMIIYLEFCDAIKAGDIGRIEESLKWITVMFQNGCNNNYALELLYIHCALHY
ncbi:hypothetical protein FBU30_003220, partial [Linnemannia zychae]